MKTLPSPARAHGCNRLHGFHPQKRKSQARFCGSYREDRASPCACESHGDPQDHPSTSWRQSTACAPGPALPAIWLRKLPQIQPMVQVLGWQPHAALPPFASIPHMHLKKLLLPPPPIHQSLLRLKCLHPVNLQKLDRLLPDLFQSSNGDSQFSETPPMFEEGQC